MSAIADIRPLRAPRGGFAHGNKTRPYGVVLFPFLLIILKRDKRGVVVFGLGIEYFAEHLFAYRSEFLLLIVVMKHHISRF